MNVTAEQLELFKAVAVKELNLRALEGNPLVQFLKENMIMHGDPATASDDTRSFYEEIKKTAGTVGEVNGAGVPQGEDFNSYTTFTETGILTEISAFYSEIHRNANSVKQILNSIDFSTEAGMNKGIKALRADTRFNKMINDMAAAMRTDIENQVTAILNAATSTTVFGTDTLAATSGTLLDFGNLISSVTTPDEDTLEAIVQVLAGQKDANGNALSVVVPKFWLVSQDWYASLFKLLNTQYATNVNARTILDAMGSGVMVIIPLQSLTAKTIHVFTGASGFDFYAETAEPIFFLAKDENGNSKWHYRWLVKPFLKLRVGYVMVKN